MIFRVDGPRGDVLPVTLSDVVGAVTSTHPSLQWFLGEFYGAGYTGVLYPGNRTYEDFTNDLASTRSLLTAEELSSVASATFDIYDVFLVGIRVGESVARYVGHNPVERFQTFASQHAVVAECVDSGFWRISIQDDRLAKKTVDLLAAIPGVVISEFSLPKV
ncbi:MAG: hypothetical protein JO231_16655 [Acidobacteria bacterium]|nr:hypothetical protein [Acidobacteriota bacterium]